MIKRYSRPEMVKIWSSETKFKIWYEIEAYACEAQAALGVIPTSCVEAIWKAKDIKFDIDNIFDGEKVTTYVKYGRGNAYSVNITKANNNLGFNTAIKKTPAAQSRQATNQGHRCGTRCQCHLGITGK